MDTGPSRDSRRWFWLCFLAFLPPSVGLAQLPPINLPSLPTTPFSHSTAVQPVESQTSISDQLLYLKAAGAVNPESPTDSYTIFLAAVPLFYNMNLSSGSQPPPWLLDPQVQFIRSARLGKPLLLTLALGLDTEVYPDHSDYNQDSLSGQFQLNFTDKGIHFKAAPFLAYKTDFSVPSALTGYAWINDVEAGYNFNGIFGTGKGPLEVDFNPGISQRWVQVNDSQGNWTNSGSSDLEAEAPFVYKFSRRFFLIVDPTAYLRFYDMDPSPADQNRVDSSLSCPLFLDWTLGGQWQLLVLAVYTAQGSSVSGQDINQLNAGLELQTYF